MCKNLRIYKTQQTESGPDCNWKGLGVRRLNQFKLNLKEKMTAPGHGASSNVNRFQDKITDASQ